MVTPTTVLLASSLGVFMAFIDAMIVNIAFPDIRKSSPTASFGSLSWILNSVLQEVSIFAELDPALPEEIADRAEIVHISGGTHLFRAGDPADSLYVVL